MLGKKAETKAWMWIVGAAVLVLLLNPMGITDTLKSKLSTKETPTTSEPTSGATRPDKCYIEDTTLTVGPGERMFVPTTKTTSTYHRVFTNGVDRGLSLDGATLGVNPGDEVAIYWAENDSNYYAAKQEFTVPCAGMVTAGEMPDSNAYKLYYNGTGPAIRIYNTNDGNVNTGTATCAEGASNQSLDAGDVKTLKFEMDGQYQKAFSPYGNMIVVAEGNKSVYDELKLGSFEKVATPDQHTLQNADAQAWTYKLPNLISNAALSTNLVIDVDDSTAPYSTAGVTGHRITLSFYDEDWYQNSDTGKMEYGVETNRDADVGFQEFNSYVCVN